MRQATIGEAGDRVLFVDQQWPAQQPRRHAAGEDVHRRIAAMRQPTRRLVGDSITAVDQHHPARLPWRQPADIELQPLSSINDVFERLQHGDVASRVVLDFTNR